MSYYQGDYYQGDYYQGDYAQGDPFIGGLIGWGASWLGKKLLKRGAKKALVASVGSGALIGGAGGVAGGVGSAMLGQALWTKGKQIYKSYRGTPPPGPISMTIQGQPSGPGMGMAGCCPPGFHLNKTLTRMGHPPGSTCVRNRSMNVANPRALRRSIRRVTGFAKLAARSRKTIKAAARAI